MDLLLSSLQVGTWIHKTSRRELGCTRQRCPKAIYIVCASSEVQNNNKTSFACQQEKQRLQMAMGKIPRREALTLLASGLPWTNASDPGG